ncbi:MAG: ethylbenzene dehydrogenase-related protein, partial [Dehalococcoidia bacterium]
MVRKLFYISICLALLLLTVGAVVSAEKATLIAVKVGTDPVLDGSGEDEVWANAPALSVSPPGVTLKAVYTDQDLYVLATWSDSTASFTRGGSWSWDGSAWVKSSGQSEDRISFFWDMNIPNFAAQGCMTKCHPGTHEEGGEDDAWLETGKGDMWHMKAARSLGVISMSQSGTLTIDPDSHEATAGTIIFDGYVDDKWLGPWSADNAPDGGRYGDDGSSTYKHNRNEDKTAPLYMESAPSDYADAMTLYQSEIDLGEAIEVATADVDALWAHYAALNAVVPERILRAPEGSRADVREAATWSDGTWTAEFQRALD